MTATRLSSVDILLPVHNRVEFTRVVCRALGEFTSRSLVGTVYVFDDNSEDGAAVVAYSMLRRSFADVRCIRGSFGGPVEIMNRFLLESSAALFAKIDNDTVVCKHWLDVCMNVMFKGDNHVDLIGIEPHHLIHSPTDEEIVKCLRLAEPAEYIGGIGLMRRDVFGDGIAPLVQTGRYFGFTSWQIQHPLVDKAWLSPALPIVLLDRIPDAPWRNLSEEYVKRGWQRHTSYYSAVSSWMWESLQP